MATELITGKRGEPHVHSHDVRQLHRGIFGQGKYILKDQKNCAVSVTPGSVQIADGGIIWNGCHIRNWAQTEPYTYASPASTQTVGVYLHYTKDIDANENCVFEIFVGSDAPQTNDNFGDLDVDAYTLFYSFTHNSDGTITKGTYHFELIDSIEYINLNHLKFISNITERKELASYVKAGSTVTLKENINNFEYFEIVIAGSYARYPTSDFDSVMRDGKNETRITIPTGASNNESTLPYSGFRNLHIKISGTSFKYARGNTFILNNGGVVNVYENPIIAKIYGVQRKW